VLYVEATNIVHFIQRGLKVSGIQRVTWEVILRLHRDLGDEGVCLLKFDQATNELLCAPVKALGDMGSERRKIGVPEPGTQTVADRWREFSATSNDTLLLIEGMGWESRYRAYERLKSASGIRICQIVHDIIPVAVPEYCGRNHANEFSRVLPLAMRMADDIFTVSEFSKQDLLKHCASMIDAKTRIRVWPLAHEFPLEQDESTILPKSVKNKFVLSVGTIEDRKRQYLTLKAWGKLAAKYGSELPQLVLVGRYGIFTRHLIKLYVRIVAEKFGSKRVIVLNNCDDEILQALYFRCLFSVYVSCYEGWGLPVGESLWCGKPVLSAKATSLPEVGHDLVDYVDPTDEPALVAAIEKLAFDDSYRIGRAQSISQAKLRDWNDVSTNLIELIRAN
jgi:glycosyltransferase involved in cell wall biosynthesis